MNCLAVSCIGVLAALGVSVASGAGFKSRITHGQTCGYSSGGTLDSIKNSDTGSAYDVTVESKGNNGSTSQKVHRVAAGGTTPIGCTQAPAGHATWTNTVVGEAKAR